MAFIKISTDALRELLVESYEKGWRGSLELKDQVAESLLKDAGEILVEPIMAVELDGTSLGGSVDSVTISSDPSIRLDGEPLLNDMSPDQVIEEFGLQDRPEISVPEGNVWIGGSGHALPPSADPADRQTWNINVVADPPDSPRVSER